MFVSAVPLFENDKKAPYQVVVIFKDITKDRFNGQIILNTKKELAERKRFLRATLNALPCLVAYIDKDYKYQFAYKIYQDWFGINSEDFIGKTMAEMVGVETFQKAKEFLDKSLKGIEQSFEIRANFKVGGA